MVVHHVTSTCEPIEMVHAVLHAALLLAVVAVTSGVQSVRTSAINNILYKVGLLSSSVVALPILANADNEYKGKLEYQPALEGLDYGKPRTIYPDFTQSKSGLQYKIIKEGDGKSCKTGDRVVIDWEGYTIGYYGRPFQTRNKVKGGAFDATESDNFRWILGSNTAIQALDEGVRYLKEGGIAQIVVPVELGYPLGDPDHELVGPKPSTFSGQRALNFVLDNKNLIDKTLLMNIKLIRVDQNGKFKKDA